ncbi:Neuroblast differentiation-associated protein AHNAK, partial [Spheniscus mendiculus]
EVDVTLPAAETQAPGVEVTVETAAGGDGEKGRFKMPDVKMPSVKLPKVKAPHVQVSLPKAEVSLPKAQAEVQEGEVALQGPDAEGGLEAAAGKVEGGGMKIHMPKVKVPSVVFSKPTVKAPKLDADVSLHKVDASLPEADLKAGAGTISVAAPDIKLPSFKMPKFDKPKFGVSPPKAEGLEGEVSLPTAEVDLPSATVTAAGEGPALGLKADIPGTKTEGAGWKVEKPSLKMPKADVKAPKVDISLPSVDVTLPKASVDLQAPEAALTLEGEAKAPEKEAAKTKDGKFKMPKFGMPSFGWSSSREAKGTVAADVDVSLKEPQVTVPSGTAEVDVTLPAAEIQVPTFEVVIDSPCGKDDEMGKSKSSLFRMPKVSLSKSSKPQGQSKSGAEMSLSEALCYSVTEETPAVFSGSVGSKLPDTKGDSGSKNTKFRIPSLGFSKVDIGSSKIEQDSPLAKEDITLTKYQMNLAESESKLSSLADENLSKSQFTMPKISFPKIKGQKVQVSLPVLETDICGPKQEKEGVSVQKSEKGSSGEGAGMGIKMPKVTVPTLEFSKPEVKAPKIDMDVKSPDTSVEKTSNEIAVGDIEIKIEGPEGKTKMSKFQMPKFGIIHSKGKGSEKEVSQSKSEVKVPQLKAMVEITDIAVEGPNLEVECGTGIETYSPKVKMTKADNKASEADVHFPSADISIPKTDSDIQDSDAALKIKGEIKQDGDGEEKEGHFKMPKFKLPSFSWSPKKEASVKPDSGANLEDHKLAVMSSRIDTEVRGTAADDQGAGPALDLEISVEQKSPVKKPQFVMPKISLSKIKVPKSQTHSPKAEADATILKTEREGDGSIQTPDTERYHSERTEEGAQISIKLADVDIPTLEFSKIETGASQTEMGVSSAKIDAVLPPSEGSFQQVVLKSSSTDEDTIQKTGIKFPRGEASIELRSPEIVTERSSVVDGRKMKLESPEGKTKMPKFQKPKFGISLTKGKVPETEISSPKIEAELPQLKMTNKIADIAVGVPASELTSDMSDPGVEGIPKLGDSVKSSDVSLSKIEGDTSLSTERTDSRVNIPKTETYADIVKHGAEGQKMHTSEFTVSSAELSKSYLSTSEIDKDNSLTNRFPTITLETVDKSQGGPELNIKIPKLKIPRFTFKALPTEIDVSVSKVVTDPKGSSTDIEV